VERVVVLRPEEPEGRIMKRPIQLKSAPNKPAQTKPAVRKLCCAVYTRKSSEEGLEQEFNSLHAQREACENYIASQRGEGWVLVPDQYDDGGISGATLDRPALKRLLADIVAHRVDIVVVYKIDRLSRSLMDFSKLAETFDGNEVSFVSVTQQFNTSTSMGRLTLNMLLSFAQFEREVIGERIRDKFAASRQKGMWMGGYVPLGYDLKDRKLIVNEAEAETVRRIFEKFIKTGSVTELVRGLRQEGVRGKRGRLIDKGYVYQLFRNRVYIGEAVHKGASYPGEHDAIGPWAPKLRSPPFFSVRARPLRLVNPRKIKHFGLHFGSAQFAAVRAHPASPGTLERPGTSDRVHWRSVSVRDRTNADSKLSPKAPEESTREVTVMHELSDTKIRNAKPADKEYTLADGQGLSVRVQTNSSKIWLYRYRFGGKRKNMSFGVFSTVTLKMAREKRHDAEKLLDQRQDPAVVREAKRLEEQKTKHTFRAVGQEWLTTKFEKENKANQLPETCRELGDR
jgi:DNA invertase Pin-like site-specific DNA recombinase